MSLPTNKTNFLVIDDSDSIRLFVSYVLKKEGIACQSAPSGEAGLDLIGRSSVSLVFLDMRMPGGMSGVETLKEIRRLYNRTFPVLAFSASNESEVPLGKEGFDGFVSKPVDRFELIEKAKKALSEFKKNAI